MENLRNQQFREKNISDNEIFPLIATLFLMKVAGKKCKYIFWDL